MKYKSFFTEKNIVAELTQSPQNGKKIIVSIFEAFGGFSGK